MPVTKSPASFLTPEWLMRANEFLKLAPQFQLGSLPTESRHPKTLDLSRLANEDIPRGLAVLKEVELDALKSLEPHFDAIEVMAREIRATFESGRRVFFCGCGATGRLSLSLETLWRIHSARAGRPASADKVASFIAGGDYALVRSIENFEDHPDFGERQLHDLGFTRGDLLIATTEGGETPFVIGATEAAARDPEGRKPFFLFCNPIEPLVRAAERSRRVLANPRVRWTSFKTGPMALTGSTRLQATTVLMLAAGAALFSADETDIRSSIEAMVQSFALDLSQTDFRVLKPLIEAEARAYSAGDHCQHLTSEYGITVLTDTTERSPTFSLLPFENARDEAPVTAWTYLTVKGAKNSSDAWQAIIAREPRPLNWEGFSEKYGRETLYAFDFDHQGLERRKSQFGNRLHLFDIDPSGDEIVFKFDQLEARLKRPSHLLREHLLLKCAMNVSSTLVMGRLGRFQSNLMLFVRATNNKLIDRAIRFTSLLVEDAGCNDYDYATVCETLFKVLETLPSDGAAVPETANRLIKAYRGRVRVG